MVSLERRDVPEGAVRGAVVYRSAFFAREWIARGEVIHMESPIIDTGHSMAGIILTWLRMSESMVRVLGGKSVPRINASGLTDDENRRIATSVDAVAGATVKAARESGTTPKTKIKAVVPGPPGTPQFSTSDKNLFPGVTWLYAMMKALGWGHEERPGRWLLYRMFFHIEPNCLPNCLVRAMPDRKVGLVALRNIEKGEAVSISRTQHLLSSSQFRRMTLMLNHGVFCACLRCEAPADTSRRMWCPVCKKKMESGEKPSRPPFAVPFGKAWQCTGCLETFATDIMPQQVESLLEGIYSRLSNEMATLPREQWMSYVEYLRDTTSQTLSPYHWLNTGVHILLTRFYLAHNAYFALKEVLPNFQRVLVNSQLIVDEEEQILRDMQKTETSCGNTLLIQAVAPLAAPVLRALLMFGMYSRFQDMFHLTRGLIKTFFGREAPSYSSFREANALMKQMGPRVGQLGSIVESLCQQQAELSITNVAAAAKAAGLPDFKQFGSDWQVLHSLVERSVSASLPVPEVEQDLEEQFRSIISLRLRMDLESRKSIWYGQGQQKPQENIKEPTRRVKKKNRRRVPV